MRPHLSAAGARTRTSKATYDRERDVHCPTSGWDGPHRRDGGAPRPVVARDVGGVPARDRAAIRSVPYGNGTPSPKYHQGVLRPALPGSGRGAREASEEAYSEHREGRPH